MEKGPNSALAEKKDDIKDKINYFSFKKQRKMEFLDDFGIVVNTIEISNEGENIPLTHIFWGKSIKQALGRAISHLVSDLFHSTTFTGEMAWKDGKLNLSYEGKIINIAPIANHREVSIEVFEEISKAAEKIVGLQYSMGMDKIVNEISKRKDE